MEDISLEAPACIWGTAALSGDERDRRFGPSHEGTLRSCLDHFEAMPPQMRSEFCIEIVEDRRRFEYAEIGPFLEKDY